MRRVLYRSLSVMVTSMRHPGFGPSARRSLVRSSESCRRCSTTSGPRFQRQASQWSSSTRAREETQASFAPDQKFLTKLAATWASAYAEHKRRVAAVEQEVEAVAKAIEILGSDGSHDLFSMPSNPSML